MITYAVDVAEYQGDLDWKGIQSEGFRIGYIKSSGSKSRGSLFLDPFFQLNALGITPTAMGRGVYHYLTAAYPIAQAALLLDRIRSVGWSEYKVSCIVDVEDLTVDEIALQSFVNTWYELTNAKLGIYTSKGFWDYRLSSVLLSPKTPLWSAHWINQAGRTDPAKPYASQQYREIDSQCWKESYGSWDEHTTRLLQFTDHALVQGKYMDSSAFQGTLSEWESIFCGARDS